jgi:hypothetical protein
MASIHVVKEHKLDHEEAKKRGRELLERFRTKLARFISRVEWTPDGTRGTAEGKIFGAVFEVTPSQVVVDIELRGLGAAILKGQIEGTVKESLDRKFA